ncbi:AraC family transcriptional regulator [Paraflavitalea soli]|uniref:AraC family transcriptional regulator n=1 Tax=Paraflavitalea soli TaxID=2315862 RepID=A0A3B7MJF6_9BACT|nr:AraC family transcriptional regulator [Paraflavitalea soli]AXY73747.1 AraC family transcriptional regulator [Paraflavitalea soli]
MKRYHQYQPLLISDFEVDEWHHPVHSHNHYELIYIKKGRGTHTINQVPYPYKAGNVFLLGPDDEHYFQITAATRFIYLKFNDPYKYKDLSGAGYSWQKLEYLIKSRETHAAGFALTSADQLITSQLFQVVAALKEDTNHNEPLIWLQLLAIATVLQRNMPELRTDTNRSRDMQAVFCYLHKHIYTPEHLRATAIAANFNMTADYIGPWFKRNTGITLREYIHDYRKVLINQRIASRQYSLKEIAAEFGLTDESHVKKIVA